MKRSPIVRKTPMPRSGVSLRARSPKTDPSPAEKESVRERDGSACIRCGSERALITHHRLPRGRGGTNRLSNLVTLCDFGGCHDTFVESRRTEAEVAGWLVKTGHDPAEVRILWHGVWVLLGDDGTVAPEDTVQRRAS